MDASLVVLILAVCACIGWHLYNRASQRNQRALAELREELEDQKNEQARLRRQVEVLKDPEKYRREMAELRRKAEGVSAALKAFRPIFEGTVLIDHKHPRYQADLISVVKNLPKIGERCDKFFAKFGAHLDEVSARNLEKDAAWCRSYRYEDGKDLEEAEEMLFKIQLSYMALERYGHEVWMAVSAHEVE